METQPDDLSRLKIDWKDTDQATVRRRGLRSGKALAFFFLMVIAAGAIVFWLKVGSVQTVEVVKVSSVSASLPTTLLHASGYVVAQRQAAVASKATGRLVELNVGEGDRVQTGEVLARLENEDLAADLARSRANLNLAHSTLTQARAELNEAALQYDRKKNCWTPI